MRSKDLEEGLMSEAYADFVKKGGPAMPPLPQLTSWSAKGEESMGKMKDIYGDMDYVEKIRSIESTFNSGSDISYEDQEWMIEMIKELLNIE